jgi:hypothetical protein
VWVEFRRAYARAFTCRTEMGRRVPVEMAATPALRPAGFVGLEAFGLEDRLAVGVEPVGARAVVLELDAVAVGVLEVDRDGAAVV